MQVSEEYCDTNSVYAWDGAGGGGGVSNLVFYAQSTRTVISEQWGRRGGGEAQCRCYVGDREGGVDSGRRALIPKHITVTDGLVIHVSRFPQKHLHSAQ